MILSRDAKFKCEDWTTGEEWNNQSYVQVVRLWESADSDDLLSVAELKVGESYTHSEFHVERIV